MAFYARETYSSSSISETNDDLVKLELSRSERVNGYSSREKPITPGIEYPAAVRQKVCEMAAQSKQVLSRPDRLLFRLDK